VTKYNGYLVMNDKNRSCAFCGIGDHHFLIRGGYDILICADCVAHCYDIFEKDNLSVIDHKAISLECSLCKSRGMPLVSGSEPKKEFICRRCTHQCMNILERQFSNNEQLYAWCRESVNGIYGTTVNYKIT